MAAASGANEPLVHLRDGLFVSPVVGANRCAALASAGIVAGATLSAQASDALAKLHGYGTPSAAELAVAAGAQVIAKLP